MAAEFILMLDETLAADEEEMLTDSDDEKICVITVTSIMILPSLQLVRCHIFQLIGRGGSTGI